MTCGAIILASGTTGPGPDGAAGNSRGSDENWAKPAADWWIGGK